MSGAAQRRRTRAGAALMALALAAIAPSAGAQEPESRGAVTESAAARRARAALEELGRRGDGPRSPAAVLTRNLSRYFALYLVPTDAGEQRRLLGAAQRIARQAGMLFRARAQAEARAAEAGAIGRDHLRQAFARLLPAAPNDFDEVVFFPEASPTPVEIWDLEAFYDTGFAWEIVLELAQAAEAEEGALALEEDAARTLADGLNAYGLLLFRLAGLHARAELAPHLGTRHLRQAFKTIAARAAGEPAPIGEPAVQASDGRLFRDVTAEAGLEFRHTTSAWLSRFRRFGPLAPSFSGGGAAAADVDGDGWTDLALCGGRGCALYRNLGHGRFEEMTARAGIRVEGEARMPLLADFDNDGRRDLFVTYARDPNRLFLNRGGFRFEDVTRGSGLDTEGDISGPAAAVDVDGDGLLDLYVGNFGDYLAGALPWGAADAKNAQPNRLYRNLGSVDGRPRFEEIGGAAGAGDTGWAQAVSHVDFDLDGDQDLYVANDFGRNELLVNQGDGRFASGGRRTGSDDPHHGMNVAFADLNRDGRGDIFVSNIWGWSPVERRLNESNTLLVSERGPGGEPGFRASPVLSEHDTGWAWAALFFDVDNDCDDDLLVVNGFTDYLTFIQYREHPELPGRLYPINNGREANLFFVNESAPGDGFPGRLHAGSGIELEGMNSRAAALLDYDRDGDLDLVLTTFHSHARLFANDGGRGGWLRVELVGDPALGVPRDAFGAILTARAAAPPGAPPGEESGLYVWRAVTGGEGYLGMSSPPADFGLGSASEAELEVRWPGGGRQRLRGLPAGRSLRLWQGRGSR